MTYKSSAANRKNRKRYYYENQEKAKESSRTYYAEHKEERAEYAKKYQTKNRETLTEYYKQRRKNMPWLASYKAAQQRCQNSKQQGYNRYGGRGIKFMLTSKEVKDLWMRDNASEMKWASIDRINNDGYYEYGNCRFIEQSDNVRKRNK